MASDIVHLQGTVPKLPNAEVDTSRTETLLSSYLEPGETTTASYAKVHSENIPTALATPHLESATSEGLEATVEWSYDGHGNPQFLVYDNEVLKATLATNLRTYTGTFTEGSHAFKIRAKLGANLSEFSNSSTVDIESEQVISLAPESYSWEQGVSQGQPTISFRVLESEIGPFESLRVYRNDQLLGTSNNSAGTATVSHSGGNWSQNYNYTLSVVRGGEESDQTSPISARTHIGPPTNVHVNAQYGSVLGYWNTPSSEEEMRFDVSVSGVPHENVNSPFNLNPWLGDYSPGDEVSFAVSCWDPAFINAGDSEGNYEYGLSSAQVSTTFIVPTPPTPPANPTNVTVTRPTPGGPLRVSWEATGDFNSPITVAMGVTRLDNMDTFGFEGDAQGTEPNFYYDLDPATFGTRFGQDTSQHPYRVRIAVKDAHGLLSGYVAAPDFTYQAGIDSFNGQ